ncbi:hypothetical protein A2859_05605 [Candidatus Roizmanbacteria bacterium RIFCSPHIGHO2_01_FULL_37_16b]|nr:MAG: hypothetical protein A2859_05605 [Candidatus Roizmanbacteria bacterium RIFCSPHIGHO2_01_FULL_37_16b]
MGRSTVHYADNETNNILKRLHNKLRPAGTPVQRVEYIIELLLLRIFEVKVKRDDTFAPLRKLFAKDNYHLLFSHLLSLTGDQVKEHLNKNIFPFYSLLLSKSREIFPQNLPQKVQDQLVLIEEVFTNSSFTTNVQSGNMAEIISLIAQIDEERVLKTDLLGDTIESALSETGGTRDIGLYRTPDHIRQMMVAMVDPDFSDIIFDPACGTGGFLFDAYQYVLEKATKDNKWPSEKAHPEDLKYFKRYFARIKSEMPSADIANHFYRAGIGGIEYLGMIRKMAAINLYIRGLNPQNIQQGDSLKIFDPTVDANSKSIVIANPPFGAERDQPAYPNVWEEYPRESETTILFVKLMFDLLRPGGRCAVVVSEGFLTWGQNSARALRKKLLEEANLKTIISLPQGVFVSKSGQGAKTSILYFEKGTPTQKVWYYKIENDGFSMGVNRKPIPGSQIPEVIELFTQYVKQGKIPSPAKNSYAIPASWIRTLDPRIKERIRDETKKELIEKSRKEREKLITKLEIGKKQGKIDEKAYKEKLWQFDNVWENKTQNEIAKRIEKEYSYSFNLQNYRSNLTNEQIEEWKSFFKKNNLADQNFTFLPQLNPKNALDMDIARDFLAKIENKDKKLKKLEDILKKGFHIPKVKISELLIAKYEKIKKEDYQNDIEIIEKISFGDGKIYFREEKETGMDLYRAYKDDLVTSKINLHQGALALAPIDLVCSTHYQIYSINQTKVLPKFLVLILRSPTFLKKLEDERHKGIKNEQGPKFLFEFSVPLPSLENQQEIIEKIERQKGIIEGTEKILNEWEVDELKFIKYPTHTLKSLLSEPLKNGVNFQKSQMGKGIKLINVKDIYVSKYIDLSKLDLVDINLSELHKNKIQSDDILFVRSSVKKEGVGYCSIARNVKENIVFSGFLIRARFNTKMIIPEFAFYWLRSKTVKNYIISDRSPVTITNIDQEKIENIDIPLAPLKVQRDTIVELDKEIEVLEKIRFLKSLAEKRVEEILNNVWGEEKQL